MGLQSSVSDSNFDDIHACSRDLLLFIWDPNFRAAAIPSGVGFLGAGLIWKGSLSDGNGGEVHQVKYWCVMNVLLSHFFFCFY